VVSLASQRGTVWFVWTCVLTLLFGRIAAYNLGNYRPVTNDEVELMSVAYKLAAQGVMGSDLFAGFFGADQHYLMTLPLQQVMEAVTFRVFGAGIAQARWVSLLAGVSVIWSVGWLAYRWYGLGTAVLCQLFLVAWPSDLTAAANGLPLFGVARTARYDVLAVALTWLAIVLLDVVLRRPRPVSGFALGICCGLAALSTFTGTFVLPLVALTWVFPRGRCAFRDWTLYWILAGAAMVLATWAAFAIRYPADLAGQLAVYGGRGDFLSPSFYLSNLLNEPSRYYVLPSSAPNPDTYSPASSVLFAIGLCAAVAYITLRRWRTHATGDRIVWSSLLVFEGLLLFFDQTKSPLYAIVLFPSMCLALAALFTGVLGWVFRPGQPLWLRVTTGALSLGLVLTIGSDAVRAYQFSLAQSTSAGLYLGVGQEIESSLAPGTPVLGPERWWWALHDHPYLSLRNLWFQWSVAARNGQTPQFVDWVASSQADSVVVNDNVRGDLLDFPDTVQQQFWTFINSCTQRVANLNDPTYLGIEVYEIIKPSPRPEVCGTRA
jgi:4-amino-4-deoxy-L-arabinose transferase-like glycosyltransferase